MTEVAHFSALPKGHCVFMFPTHVQAMITGCENLQQNSKGQITVTYQGGQKKSVAMSDLNLALADDFMATFKETWKRLEGLS